MKTECSANRSRGFNRVELLVIIVVVGFVAVQLGVVLHAAKYKHYGRIQCVNNLKQINIALRVWAGNHGGKYPMQVVLTNNETLKRVTNGSAYLFWQTVANELGAPKLLHCYDDKKHKEAASFSRDFNDANISYFFSLDAVETYPQMILDGDDNLAVDGVRVKSGILNVGTNVPITWTKERHRRVGNIGMADGSIQMVTSNGLNAATLNSTVGVPPNAVPPRWVIP